MNYKQSMEEKKMPANVTAEYKAEIIKRMLAPNNESVPSLSKETGLTKSRLYEWRRKELKRLGVGDQSKKKSEKYTSEDKFMIVMETFGMTERELGDYCRSKGLFRESILSWRTACTKANVKASLSSKPDNDDEALKSDLKKAQDAQKALEKELRRKEKALAEMAALAVLRKKAQSIWGEDEEN